MIKIVAVGGGENGRPGTTYETRRIDEELVRISAKKHPRVLFIPPPSDSQEQYFQIMKKIFVRLGCAISPLYLSNPKPDKKMLEKVILGSDIIYVGGGNTLKMLNYWRKHGIDTLLQNAAKRGIVLSGLSAGAICWFRFGCSDSRRFTNPHADLIKIRALGLVPAMYCPHYDVETDRRFLLKKLMKRTKEVCLAFDNCAAIEIVNDTYKIITSRRQANAYKVYWKNGRYHEELIEKKNTFSRLDALLQK